jgi:hypothetical protein
MIPCRLVSALLVIIPFRRLQENLLSHHAERCPCCEAKLLSKHETRPWLIEENDIQDDPDFWSTVEDKIRRDASEKIPRPMAKLPVSLRWAAIAALFISTVAGFWFFRNSSPEGISPETHNLMRFRLNYIRIDGAPVEPVVIQPRDTDLVIVWAAITTHFP